MSASSEEEREDSVPAPRERTRRSALTPEQRRLLGTSRTIKAPVPLENEPVPEAGPDPAATTTSDPERTSHPVASAKLNAPDDRPRQPHVAVQTAATRAVELSHAIIVLCGLILIAGIFFIGRKYDAIKYHIMTRVHAGELEGDPNKFPGVSSEELVETALAAERRGNWQEATDRFIAAKRRNRALPGILFRLGKSAFDRGDLAGADTAFDHAIKFGENLPVANYYRGLIAVRRHELPAAIHYFEAAANAEPFVSDFYYFWAEALRLDQHPREAIKRYEQALHRTPSTTDATLCQFKIRLARLEAVESDKVRAELEAARQAGPLAVDWIMTDAALQLQAGKIAEAERLISEARDKGVTGLFLTCAGDTLFRRAGEAHPEIALLIGPSSLPVQ